MTGARGDADPQAARASGADAGGSANAPVSPAPVVTLGETMALMTGARMGSLAHVDQMHVSIGGAESNVAVGLSRLGTPVRWIGRVGDDSLGRRVVRELRGEHVEVRGIVDPDAPTGLMLKELTGPGTARVLYYRSGSAGSRLSPDDLAPGAVEEAALLHLTGITPLLSDSAREACRTAVRRARAAGVPVSFDVNFRRALAPESVAAEVLSEFAESADILFGAVDELALVLGTEPNHAAVRESLKERADSAGGSCAPRLAAEVVAKLGEDGAAVFVTGEAAGAESLAHGAALREVQVDGHRISVVDTVGAGDSFVAGYLSGRLEGLGVEERLIRANACGAYMCTAPGDWEGAPTPRDLASFGAAGADPVQR